MQDANTMRRYLLPVLLVLIFDPPSYATFTGSLVASPTETVADLGKSLRPGPRQQLDTGNGVSPAPESGAQAPSMAQAASFAEASSQASARMLNGAHVMAHGNALTPAVGAMQPLQESTAPAAVVHEQDQSYAQGGLGQTTAAEFATSKAEEDSPRAYEEARADVKDSAGMPFASPPPPPPPPPQQQQQQQIQPGESERLVDISFAPPNIVANPGNGVGVDLTFGQPGLCTGGFNETGTRVAPSVAEEDEWAAELLLRVNAHRRSKDLHGFAEWGEGMMKPLELPAWFKNLEHVGGWAMQLAESAGVPRATWEPLIQAGQGVSKAVGGAAMDVADLIRGQPEVVQWSLLPGDHVRVRGVAGFMALTHHAIYIGDGKIMHFTGGVTDKANATCKVDSLRSLYYYGRGRGLRLMVVDHPNGALPREEIVQRALSLEGNTGYNLFSNNCEHVVNWCITNQSESHQVRRFMEDPLSLGKEVVRMQEEAGTPLDIGEICLTLLPPALTAPFLMARAKVDSTLRDLAPAGKSPFGWRVPTLPFRKTPEESNFKARFNKWVEGVKLRATPPFLRAAAT